MRDVDLPLLLASGLTAGQPERFPLDRVRMQKAIFLLSQRGSDKLRSFYSYRPYNWGPYSDALTEDVRNLQSQGKLTVVNDPANRYGRYIATTSGEADAALAWDELNTAERSFLIDVRSYVTGSSFQKLLREVYAAYPEYATASHFQG